MKIEFSRHAKRRMKLYNVAEADVMDVIQGSKGIKDAAGRLQVVDSLMRVKYHFPLKVVYFQKDEKIVVITAYPVRKERRR